MTAQPTQPKRCSPLTRTQGQVNVSLHIIRGPRSEGSIGGWMRHLSSSIALCALLGFAGPAGASVLTYNANMNFDPTAGESYGGAPGGTGTITGTFAIDTASQKVVAIDLTENTNDPSHLISPCCGFPSAESFTFTDLSLTTVSFGQAPDKFGGLPYAFVSTQSPCCFIDGFQGGPGFQFDFPYPQGGAVQPGNFDSINSGYQYLFGSVALAAPEPATWAMILAGFAAIGCLGRRKAGMSATAV